MKRRSFFQLSAAATCGILTGRSAAAAPAAGDFQLGCVTYNLLRDMDLETVIHTLEEAGLAAVELRTGHKHGVEPSISAAERTKVRERFAQSKVRLLSFGTECEFHSPDASVRKHNVEVGKTYVDLAHDTGALGVKVRPNGLPKEVSYETTIQSIAGGLRELGDYAQTKGIEIWMEVHGRETSVPKVSSDILRAANHKSVGACWNSNSVDVVDGSVKQSFALLGSYIRNCHITDIISNYPYSEFFHLLRGIGYNRYTLAEVGQPSCETVRFLKYYKALWQQLKA